MRGVHLDVTIEHKEGGIKDYGDPVMVLSVFDSKGNPVETRIIIAKENKEENLYRSHALILLTKTEPQIYTESYHTLICKSRDGANLVEQIKNITVRVNPPNPLNPLNTFKTQNGDSELNTVSGNNIILNEEILLEDRFHSNELLEKGYSWYAVCILKLVWYPSNSFNRDPQSSIGFPLNDEYDIFNWYLRSVMSFPEYPYEGEYNIEKSHKEKSVLMENQISEEMGYLLIDSIEEFDNWTLISQGYELNKENNNNKNKEDGNGNGIPSPSIFNENSNATDFNIQENTKIPIDSYTSSNYSSDDESVTSNKIEQNKSNYCNKCNDSESSKKSTNELRKEMSPFSHESESDSESISENLLNPEIIINEKESPFSCYGIKKEAKTKAKSDFIQKLENINKNKNNSYELIYGKNKALENIVRLSENRKIKSVDKPKSLDQNKNDTLIQRLNIQTDSLEILGEITGHLLRKVKSIYGIRNVEV